MATRVCNLIPGLHDERQVVRGWEGKNQTVESIENPAMTTQNRAEILDVQIPFEH